MNMILLLGFAALLCVSSGESCRETGYHLSKRQLEGEVGRSWVGVVGSRILIGWKKGRENCMKYALYGTFLLPLVLQVQPLNK